MEWAKAPGLFGLLCGVLWAAEEKRTATCTRKWPPRRARSWTSWRSHLQVIPYNIAESRYSQYDTTYIAQTNAFSQHVRICRVWSRYFLTTKVEIWQIRLFFSVLGSGSFFHAKVRMLCKSQLISAVLEVISAGLPRLRRQQWQLLWAEWAP